MAFNRGKATFTFVDRHSDWCHLCGIPSKNTVEIRYPHNAEHETKQTEFIRICRGCAISIELACESRDSTASLPKQ